MNYNFDLEFHNKLDRILNLLVKNRKMPTQEGIWHYTYYEKRNINDKPYTLSCKCEICGEFVFKNYQLNEQDIWIKFKAEHALKHVKELNLEVLL